MRCVSIMFPNWNKRASEWMWRIWEIYWNTVFFFLHFEWNFVWHFSSMASVSRYSNQLLKSYTTIHKWEKFHWIWHHIIHPKRQVTLMWNIFFVVATSYPDVCDLSIDCIGWLILVVLPSNGIFHREFWYLLRWR